METTQTITAHNIRTHVFDEGQGPPIIMLHGWAATADCWRFTFDELKSEYRVIAPDLPGHGRSEGGWRPYGTRFYVQWLAELMDVLGIQEAVLLGNSLGGAISLAFVLEYPERVTRLVPIDALGISGTFPFETARQIVRRLPYAAGIVLRWPTALLRYLRGMVFVDPAANEEVILTMARLNDRQGIWYLWSGLRTLLGDFLPPGRRRSFAQRLGTVTVPTMIVWGRHDGLLPVRHAFAGCQNMPEARVCIFERSAHLPMMEEAEGFNIVLRAFLTSA